MAKTDSHFGEQVGSDALDSTSLRPVRESFDHVEAKSIRDLFVNRQGRHDKA